MQFSCKEQSLPGGWERKKNGQCPVLIVLEESKRKGEKSKRKDAE